MDPEEAQVRDSLQNAAGPGPAGPLFTTSIVPSPAQQATLYANRVTPLTRPSLALDVRYRGEQLFLDALIRAEHLPTGEQRWRFGTQTVVLSRMFGDALFEELTTYFELHGQAIGIPYSLQSSTNFASVVTKLDHQKKIVTNLLEAWIRGQEDNTEIEGDTMLELLLKLYTTAMVTGVTSPMPHLVGPPGAGKSTVFRQLADIAGVQLHVVNVSRISPLGLEGLEMPDEKSSALRLLVSEMWTQAEEGDIYLFDEFLRGFPEVYNGLLDIFTGREVRGFQLPKVFIAGASNSIATYDGALEDRLLHITVPNPRKKRSAEQNLRQIIIDELGLHPDVKNSYEMDTLMQDEVLPTFELLDKFDARKAQPLSGVAPGDLKGSSVRKLIGQAKLRHVDSAAMRDLIAANNRLAMQPGKMQYMFLLDGKYVPADYESTARGLHKSPKLTDIQRQNLELNLQLIEMENAKRETNTEKEDAHDDTFAVD